MADDVVNLTKSQQTAVPTAASAVNTPATETAKAVAEAAAAVDVLVRQVHAAGVGYLAVDDQDLAVVAVVVVGGDHRSDRREHLAGDAQLFQHLRVSVG